MADPAPDASRATGASRRFAWSTVDQALSSASNFILIFLIARGSSPTELGFLLIGYSILTLGVVVARSGFGAILGIDLPTASPRDAERLVARTLGALLPVSSLAAISLAAFAVTVPVSRDGGATLLLLAAIAPVVLLQDVQRFWAVAEGNPRDAAAADAVWAAIALLGFLAPAVLDTSFDATAGAAIWALGATAGATTLGALGYWRRPQFQGAIKWAWGDTRRRNLGGDAVLGQASPLLTVAVVAVVGGPQIVAAVRAAATLFGPLNLLTATIPLALVPEAVRAGPRRSRRLFRTVVAGFGVASVVWGIAIHLAPIRIGSELLGETFVLAQAIILITAAEYVGLGLWAVARARFRAQQRLRRALHFRMAFSIAALILPVGAVLLVGTATAVAIGTATASLTIGVLAYSRSRVKIPAHHS